MINKKIIKKILEDKGLKEKIDALISHLMRICERDFTGNQSLIFHTLLKDGIRKELENCAVEATLTEKEKAIIQTLLAESFFPSREKMIKRIKELDRSLGLS